MSIRSWKDPGKGISRSDGGLRRIVTGFDPETFDQVRDLAKKSGVSFSEKVRELVEFGLNDIEEDQQGAK